MDDIRILNLVAQGGSFSLLALLVIWVIRFIPQRVEKADELRALEAREKKEAAEIVRSSIQELIATHKEELQYERAICEKRQTDLEKLVQELHTIAKQEWARHYELLRDIGHGVKDVQQAWANERALQKMQAQAKKPPSQER